MRISVRRIQTLRSRVLACVIERPGITIPQIADRLNIATNRLYGHLPALVADGKVELRDHGWYPRRVLLTDEDRAVS